MLKWGITPKYAGWYWVRCRDFDKAVVKVFKAKNGLLCCILPGGPKMACDFGRFEWAGPVPEPMG